MLLYSLQVLGQVLIVVLLTNFGQLANKTMDFIVKAKFNQSKRSSRELQMLTQSSNYSKLKFLQIRTLGFLNITFVNLKMLIN